MPTCLFCQVQLTKANRSKEHAIPRWIVRRLECEEEGYLSQELTYPKVPNEVLTQQVQSINSIVLGHVCTACNGGWMSALEVRTTPLLEALWKPMSPTILTTEQCLTIAKWTFKTAATVSYASDYKKIIPRQHIYDFFTTQCLPANSTVDLAYCAGSDRLIQSLLGGDKRFAIRDPNVTEEELKDTYVITLDTFNICYNA
jgi:hypothetical protein